VTIRGPFAVFLLLLLFVSLAANFMVAGFVAAGRLNAPRPAAATAAVDVDRVLANAVSGFPTELQRAIAEAGKANRPQLRARLDAVQKARQEMFDAMRAQPFDPVALDAAFADYRMSTAALQKVGEDLVAKALVTVPPTVRSKIKPPQPAPGPIPAIPTTPRAPST
jgi:uncharacterized membrane protein